MNLRSTWWLFTVALALLAFIFFVERHLDHGDKPPVAVDVFAQLPSTELTSIEIKLARETIRVENRNGTWRMTSPVGYAVDAAAIKRFVEGCLNLKRASQIPVQEMAAQTRGLADFGLQPPQAVISFQFNGKALEARVGSRTPVGAQLYLQVGDDLEVQVVDAAFLELMPQSSAEWRERTLLDLAGVNFNRIGVRNGPLGGFEIQRDATNQLWQLTKPAPVKRADNAKIKFLIEHLRTWPVQQFETDDPGVDLTRYGLQPPETELTFGQGTNDLVVVQFGKATTNDASLVYARRLSTTNVVLVQRELLDAIRLPFATFRDRRLVTAPPALVDQIEVRGQEQFVVHRQTNFTWTIQGATNRPADVELVRNLLESLANLAIVDFVADVVPDDTKYGLPQPTLQYTLSMTVTNALGVTNQTLAQVNFGKAYDDKVYTRITGEAPVYGTALTLVRDLPQRAFLFRERRIWAFAATNIASFTFEANGKSRRMVRNASGAWVLAPGSQGIIPSNSFQFEASLDRLGEMRVDDWVAEGADKFAYYGITDDKPRITLEFDPALNLASKTLRFGRQGASLRPYASVELDGVPVVFEFPIGLYVELGQDLELPKLIDKR